MNAWPSRPDCIDFFFSKRSKVGVDYAKRKEFLMKIQECLMESTARVYSLSQDQNESGKDLFVSYFSALNYPLALSSFLFSFFLSFSPSLFSYGFLCLLDHMKKLFICHEFRHLGSLINIPLALTPNIQ